MSFGFSPSDIVTLVTLVTKAYKSWHGACGDYADITHTLRSLQLTISRISSHFSPNQRASVSKEDADRLALEYRDLKHILQGCTLIVTKLQEVVDRHSELRTENRQLTWARLKFACENLQVLRAKVREHTQQLSVFLQALQLSSIGRLDCMVKNLPNAIMERLPLALGHFIDSRVADSASARGSVLTVYDDDDQEVWKQFRRDLIKVGIRSEAIKQHYAQLQAFSLSLIKEDTDGEVVDTQKLGSKHDSKLRTIPFSPKPSSSLEGNETPQRTSTSSKECPDIEIHTSSYCETTSASPIAPSTDGAERRIEARDSALHPTTSNEADFSTEVLSGVRAEVQPIISRRINRGIVTLEAEGLHLSPLIQQFLKAITVVSAHESEAIWLERLDSLRSRLTPEIQVDDKEEGARLERSKIANPNATEPLQEVDPKPHHRGDDALGIAASVSQLPSPLRFTRILRSDSRMDGHLEHGHDVQTSSSDTPGAANSSKTKGKSAASESKQPKISVDLPKPRAHDSLLRNRHVGGGQRNRSLHICSKRKADTAPAVWGLRLNDGNLIGPRGATLGIQNDNIDTVMATCGSSGDDSGREAHMHGPRRSTSATPSPKFSRTVPQSAGAVNPQNERPPRPVRTDNSDIRHITPNIESRVMAANRKLQAETTKLRASIQLGSRPTVNKRTEARYIYFPERREEIEIDESTDSCDELPIDWSTDSYDELPIEKTPRRRRRKRSTTTIATNRKDEAEPSRRFFWRRQLRPSMRPGRNVERRFAVSRSGHESSSESDRSDYDRSDYISESDVMDGDFDYRNMSRKASIRTPDCRVQ